MSLPTEGNRQPVTITDKNGNQARVSNITDGVYRLAVEALIDGGDIEIGAVELKDGATDTRANIKPNGTAISAAMNDGGLLIAGADGTTLRFIQVDSTGRVVTAPAANKTAVTFKTVIVATPGTPVQGPAVAIPDGISVHVTFRITQTGAPVGYIGESAAAVIVSTTRSEQLKGGSLDFFVTNMDKLFFDSDTPGAIFELVAEQ